MSIHSSALLDYEIIVQHGEDGLTHGRRTINGGVVYECRSR